MERCIRKTKATTVVSEGKSRKTDRMEPLRSSNRCILFLWRSFKTSHILFSTTFPSRSFRPLRNTFRSIDFALDTQAVGTERRRSRKSARVKDKTEGRGWRKEGRAYRSEGKKKVRCRGNEIAK